MLKFITTFILTLIALATFAIGNYSINDELYVHAPSGLKLRNVPDGETILATVPFGAKLKVVEARNTTTATKVVDGLNGRWAKVSYNGKTGYIFDGYLSFLPTPKEDCITLEQYCLSSFTKESEKMVAAFDESDSDGMGETQIQLFKFKGYKVIYCGVSGYEWGEENITISGISQEEGYLVAKYIYRKRMAESATYYKDKQADFNPQVFTSYILSPDGNYTAPFYTDGCSEYLGISRRKKDNLICIKAWGGC